MGLGDSAPDDSEFRVVSDGLALEDVSNSLAEVEAGSLFLLDSLDLEEGELLVLGALATLEADEYSLGVESTKSMITRVLTSLAGQSSVSSLAFVLLCPSLYNNDYLIYLHDLRPSLIPFP